LARCCVPRRLPGKQTATKTKAIDVGGLLTYPDVADAVDWLTRVFGFVSMSGLATIAPSSGSVMAR
jgi:hypothetical protein